MADVSQGDHAEPSLGELIGRTTADLSSLLRDEIELAKVEIKEEVRHAGKAGAFLGGAGLVGYLALTLLCFAAAWGLSEVVPEGVAFLIVWLVVGIVAAVMFLAGRKQLGQVEPLPQTTETIKEDVQWAKQLKN
jgi:uncharacterized membrane protein YqjE